MKNILAIVAIFILVGVGFAVETNPGHGAAEIGGTVIADRTFQNANYSFPGALGVGSASPAAKLHVNVSSGPSAIIGAMCYASGNYSIAMGYGTDATGNYSTAMGYESTASGEHSTATGYWTTAAGAG
ncbi:hypothetical protein L0Y65_01580, partial [Candidatus Micrarchaeota archaeon]|nr:hypothetical protein [Candidatus Micrarchaeota archaeon]